MVNQENVASARIALNNAKNSKRLYTAQNTKVVAVRPAEAGKRYNTLVDVERTDDNGKVHKSTVKVKRLTLTEAFKIAGYEVNDKGFYIVPDFAGDVSAVESKIKFLEDEVQIHEGENLYTLEASEMSVGFTGKVTLVQS